MSRAAFLSHKDLNLIRFRMPVMRMLVELGHEVLAVCPDGGRAGRFAEAGVRHVPYEIDRGSLNPLKEAAVVRALSKLLAELKPDLLHTFTMKPNIYGALAAPEGTKVVASVTGLGSYYSGERTLFRRGLDALYAHAMRRPGRVIFYNEDDRDEFVKLGIVSPEKVRMIKGSGVDVRRFVPVAKANPKVVVTMCARLIREKGVEQFLDAAEALKGKAVFRLAGAPDAGNPTTLDDRVGRGSVERLGWVDDVAGLLAGTDIYCLPSYYREGIPVSVLEAMAAGLPVVTTISVGCRETIQHDKSGLFVPPRDSKALIKALDRLIGDAELRRRLGEGARKRAEQVFAVDRIVDDHLAVYRELLDV